MRSDTIEVEGIDEQEVCGGEEPKPLSRGVIATLTGVQKVCRVQNKTPHSLILSISDPSSQTFCDFPSGVCVHLNVQVIIVTAIKHPRAGIIM